MEKTMKWHIVITDKETGAVAVDNDAYAFVGAFGTEKGTAVLNMAACNTVDLARTVYGAKEAIDKAVEIDPGLKVLTNLIDKLGGVKGINDLIAKLEK